MATLTLEDVLLIEKFDKQLANIQPITQEFFDSQPIERQLEMKTDSVKVGVSKLLFYVRTTVDNYGQVGVSIEKVWDHHLITLAMNHNFVGMQGSMPRVEPK